MTKFYSINELRKLTRVSVRTLHHYDEINILKPHHRTQKGHRRYSENDLLRLQQIMTLKFMGFSLVEIKKIFQQSEFNIFDSLRLQEKALSEEIIRIQKIATLINYLINQHESHNHVDWKTVIQIIEVLKLKELDSQQWYEKYLTQNEQMQFDRYSYTRSHEWQALYEEVKQNLGSDPESDQGIEIVKKWVALATEAYGDQPNMIKKLWEAFKIGIIPTQLPNDKELITYLTKAFDKLQRDQKYEDR